MIKLINWRATMKEFNYKDMPKMQCTMYAVKVLKGDWANRVLGGVNTDGLYVISFDSHYLYYCGGSPTSNKALFSALVDELSTNLGRSTQTYAEYKEEFEYMTTSTEVSRIEELEDAFNEITRESDYEACYDIACTQLDLSTLNKPQPVFTQSMADAGELPSVGMECQTSTGILTVKYIGKKVVVSEDCEGTEFMTSKKSALHSFKPIPAPINLVDGCAYQFDADGITWNGIYSKSDNTLITSNSVIKAEYLSNIIKLVPEVN